MYRLGEMNIEIKSVLLGHSYKHVSFLHLKMISQHFLLELHSKEDWPI